MLSAPFRTSHLLAPTKLPLPPHPLSAGPLSPGMNESSSHIDLPPWVSLDITHISVALAVLGTYLVTVGQISYILKEKLLLSSALVAFAVGIAVGPIGLDWLSPWQWVNFDEDARYALTFQITRIVIGIQVMFAGIDLPAAYLRRESLSLFILLLPVMTLAWFVSAGFVLLLVKGLTFLEALCIAACITPTDPILANAIVKGRWAERNVPKAVRDLISAESGANDGLGYPFLFLAVFIMQRHNESRSISSSLQHWVVTTWLYQILLACAVGAVIGYVGRKTLKFAHTRRLIDHESFLAYGVGLALFTLGVVGVLGSDDILACFVAGNSLTWGDFYRIEASEEDTFQDVIDTLLDSATFLYLGTVVPWSELSSAYISPWRLVVLGICILLFRRMPFVFALHRFVPAIDGIKQAIFTGWFGPIGVSAIYYAILALHVLPDDRVVLRSVIFPVVFFMALCSVIVHGISIPVARVAPLAVARTKSTMSVAWSGANVGVPGSASPATATSRAVSRRPSVELVSVATDTEDAQPAPARKEGSEDAGSAREAINAEEEEGMGRKPAQGSRVEFSLP
ncbi:hypothetical protein JCM10213_006346 [Rhodosporidiobolus nylandii]